MLITVCSHRRRVREVPIHSASQKFAGGDSLSISILALESEALAFKAPFRNFYSPLVACYCKKITTIQRIGKAIPH